MRRIVGAAVFVVASLGTGAVAAQDTAKSAILPVNAYTTGNQSAPNIAPNPDGSFVVVWESAGQEPGMYVGTGVYARRFDALGSPIADEFLVNEYTTQDQSLPRVAADESGNFIVVWQGQGATDPTGVHGRLFTANGTPVGPEFTVHPPTPAAAENFPAVARSDAGYVVVWEEYATGSSGEIYGVIFTGGSAAQGGPFHVNTYTTGGQGKPEVAMDASGNFLVTWASGFAGGSEIRGRAFTAAGAPLSDDFQINTSTTGYQTNHSVAPDGAGGFVVAWNDNILGYPLRAQRIDAAGGPSGPETLLGDGQVPRIHHRALGGFLVTYDSNGLFASHYDDSLQRLAPEFLLTDVLTGGTPGTPVALADTGRHVVFAWGEAFGGPVFGNVVARRGGFPVTAPFAVDERAGGGTSNLNGVLEAGERVTVDPAYLNRSGLAYTLAGTASNFTGLVGPVYTIHDASADYGTLSASLPESSAPSGSPVDDCFTATGNCLEFELTGARPAMHWDATYDEALSEQVSITRTLHIGGSFNDVPGTNIFFRLIENLFHNGITAGGPCGGYCPTDGVKRQQMAVFLLKSKNGSAYTPPSPTGTVFGDVPQSHPFAAWIEDLFNRGITGGCQANPPLFCPDAIVNRQQMAVFLLKAEEGSAYDPPDCADIFVDVPCTPGTGFSDWIEELYNRQITGGCIANPLQYCPTNPTNRQQMAAFLVKNFGLVLYGP